MFKEKIQSILKNICGALVLPVLMYVVMMIFCFQNGKMYYGSVAMWRSLISTIAASATCAYGIGIQFKSGRLDFSAGSVMLLSAIIAGDPHKIALCFHYQDKDHLRKKQSRQEPQSTDSSQAQCGVGLVHKFRRHLCASGAFHKANQHIIQHYNGTVSKIWNHKTFEMLPYILAGTHLAK